MVELEGSADGAGLRVAVTVARWNGFITRKLLEGAVSTLRECGVAESDITVAWVPGSFEVPTAAKWAAESGRFDAVICLGCVIRGETAHFEHVAGQAASGIMRVGLDTGTPIVFGVLTTETLDQALARSEPEGGHNAGADGAAVAVEMVETLRS